ncbi:MAG TPA: dTDP-4-dehydrorhamnose 3,5-epimerase [Beijerinckiaceae bacterium]|jgi:dTDP-4-dehydrorhamnose 3,5-epimerase|nr:dTDP-4-dehydrorhamnose 3,5-epimerase [Beijerinckiaceae bacterium]
MDKFSFETLSIEGPLLITARQFKDFRGYFMETYSSSHFRVGGVCSTFVQDNQSFSSERGTVRGLHFQRPPNAQAKLVRVLNGAIYDVVVDIRLGSSSYGCWCAATLTAESGDQLFVPHGFAHGFCTLEPATVVAYKVDNHYSAEDDGGIFWADPALAIDWPITPATAIVSPKDSALPLLTEIVNPFQIKEML